MSQAVTESRAQPDHLSSGPSPADEPTRRRSRGHFLTIIVMIIALIGVGITHHAAQSLRGAGTAAAGSSKASLSGMNSFALGLLLGGLRGPLVMWLWMESERLKSERNLEGVDTMHALIRMLQPEFDTVHIFQIWNKAYNISVQMVSLANKYTTILDAIDYARSVDAQRPNNINIVHQIGSVYADKLGGAAEKDYYIQQVRAQTKPHNRKQRLNRDDPGWRRLEMDPMLDASGNILPELLKPTRQRPVSLPKSADWNNGAELQYLEEYQPFPYGLSPLALGYNYLKQAQVLQSVGKQRHAQLSDLVVDSRPALALKQWAEEEWERARRIELTTFQKPIPEERLEMETPTAAIPPVAPPDPAVLEEAIFSYNRASQLMDDAVDEYVRHLQSYANNASTYQSHLAHSVLVQELTAADRDYLKAMTATGAEREKLLRSAAEHYARAMHQSEYIILKYYVDDETAEQSGYKRAEVDSLKPEQFQQLLSKAYDLMNRPNYYDAQAEDRGEYEQYIRRASTRLQILSGLLQDQADSKPQG